MDEGEIGINVPQILSDSFNTYSLVLVDAVLENSTYNNGKTVITNKDELSKVFLFLENYKIRRDFCNFSDKEITRFIPTLPRKIKVKNNDCYVESLFQILYVEANELEKNNGYRMPTNIEFENAFKFYPVYNNPKLTKNILIRLETYCTKEDTNFTRFSIEHIMPQTMTTEWLQEVGGDSSKYLTYLHTIGNLTLTADNSMLSNSNYMKKREILNEKSRCKLNNYFKTVDSWSYNSIENRAEELYNIVSEIWNINSI